jgi:WhiB family redox-sensing transcriptional regulator
VRVTIPLVAFDVGRSGSIGAEFLGRGRTSSTTAAELLDVIRRPAWQRDALCREYPPQMFFPSSGASFEPAREVCGRCLVRDACLAFALEHEEPDGCWGGLSGHERRALRPLRRAG